MPLFPPDLFARSSDALEDAVEATLVAVAGRWRSFLSKPTFIGISGSAGKTSTKDILVELLRGEGRGTGSRGSNNTLMSVAVYLLRVQPSHEFFVAELSEDHPGIMRRHLGLLRPRIGIVTVVGNDHWSNFASKDAIAAEIGELARGLPAEGTAVLNADDPNVAAMAEGCAARVLTFGLKEGATLRAEHVTAAWPERLAFHVTYGGERLKVQTRFCGAHWLPSVLGAMGGALATGRSLQACVDAIARVEPTRGRMEPNITPDGVTFIRDDFKAPLWTVDACLAFMREARARRKILVFGTLSDFGAGAGTPQKYVHVAKRAQAVADLTIFVGPWASQVLKARRPGDEESLRVFRSVREASDHVNRITREGDLVLLKGTNKQDHLFRILLARRGKFACWRDDCQRRRQCDSCPFRRLPSGPRTTREAASGSAPKPGEVAAIPPLADGEQVILGLGNPEPRLEGTPHNAGYGVVLHLAKVWGLTWTETTQAWIARGVAEGVPVCLVRVRANMNEIGGTLANLAEEMGFGVERCILVLDDLDMPLGKVRTRLSGGPGGHRGVASILDAFQSDAFRRVKIGVGQAGAKVDRTHYVLTVLDPAALATLESANETAREHLLAMLKRPPGPSAPTGAAVP